MGQMPAADRERIVSNLERSRDAFLAAISGLSPEVWAHRSQPDAWSIAECADHVLGVERLLFDTVKALRDCAPDPERVARVQGKEERLITALSDRTFKVKVPFALNPTGTADSPEHLASAFRAMRSEVIAYASETDDPLRERVARHPLLKDMDGVQWLLVISAHTDRHVAQIQEIRGESSYRASKSSGSI